MNDDFQDEIVKFATQNSTNLATAIKIVEAFEKIKKQVIADFANLLEKKIKEALIEPTWEVDTSALKLDPFGDCTGVTIRNNSWPEGLMVGIEAWSGNFNFVIWPCKTLESEVRQQIKLELSTISGSKSKNEVDWYKIVNKDYKNWTQESTLLDLYNGENGHALEYFTNELVSITIKVDKVVNPTAHVN